MRRVRGHDEGLQPLTCTLLCLLQIQTQWIRGRWAPSLHVYLNIYYHTLYLLSQTTSHLPLSITPSLPPLSLSSELFPVYHTHTHRYRDARLGARAAGCQQRCRPARQQQHRLSVQVKSILTPPIYSTPTSSLSIHV